MDDLPAPVEKREHKLLPVNNWAAWTSRGISQATCRKWGIGVVDWQGAKARVFQYRDAEGKLVAQKVRPRIKKEIRFLNGDNAMLYGRHLWGAGGKMIVVTEGELDAASISQVQGHKWPVVSVSGGASNARKALQKNLEWLQTFETVVLWFDDDGPGREAVQACAPLFRPGQVKVARLAPHKDANDALQAGKSKEIITALWQASPWRPDGIKVGSDLFDLVTTRDDRLAQQLPFGGLQAKTHGIRSGELFTICAGSGVGKSSFIRELAHDLHNRGETVGLLMLEETVRRTALGLIGIHMDRNLPLEADPASHSGFEEAMRATLTDRMVLYDHFGSTSIENILDRIRYMAVSLECRWVFLDHLSILISGMEDGDERRLIDNAMTRLKTLAMETGIGLFLVSHLRRTSEKKSHEEGGITSLSQLRGSHAIAQLSDTVVGLERDQQAENPDCTTVRVLKCRHTGRTGVAGKLHYNHETGRLRELEEDGFDDEEAF